LVVLPFCACVEYSKVPKKDIEAPSTMNDVVKNTQEKSFWLSIWLQQFVDTVMVIQFTILIYLLFCGLFFTNVCRKCQSSSS
jgi:hypothetical protein